jgi:predicted ABC-type ATPase
MVEVVPQVVIIAGPNGAGKTTLAPTLLRDTLGLFEFVNADTISDGLSAFNPDAASFDAGRIMLRTIQELAKKRKDFALESTLAGRSFAQWLLHLCRSGYEFQLLFLWLRSVDLAVERVATRVQGGGHAIPEEVIRRRYYRGLANFLELYRPIANTWVVYDNSGVSPILVASGRQREKERVLRPDLWQLLMIESQ